MMNLLETFRSPPAEYRGKPFWSWNGKLEKDELLKQAQILKEMGFGGFFMHSRTGLETEYLGDEWFDLINTMAEEGNRLGLEAWLYDEDRWPSGTAGGKVTENPSFRMKYLKAQLLSSESFVWQDRYLCVWKCEVNGLTLNTYERLMPCDISDYTGMVFTAEIMEMPTDSFYNGNTYVDTMNKAATEAFIQITHEKYAEKCEGRLGNMIQGIFTDEPHRGQLMSDFGSCGNLGDALIWAVPYTDSLFEEYEASFGSDLKEVLPELFLQMHGQIHSHIKWQFVELLQRLFLKNYIEPIAAWCKEHQIQLTGHGLQEDCLTAQTAMTGSVMRMYAIMDVPGIDHLGEWNRSYWIVKQLTSVGKQYGKKKRLSELYGCTGWQMTLEGHKNVGDWQAFHGINVRCPHLSWYTMQGEAKRDYPASIFHQSGWWREYQSVEDYFARLHILLSDGDEPCDLLVLHPVESVWSQIHPGWCDGLFAKSQSIVDLETRFQEVFEILTGLRLAFDYGDEGLLAQDGSVNRDAEGNPVLRLGMASYRKVILSGLITIRSTTLSLLEEFADLGGDVIFWGVPPDRIEGCETDRIRKLAARAIQLDFGRSSMESHMNRSSSVLRLQVQDALGMPVDGIFSTIRVNKFGTWFFLLNQDSEKTYLNIGVEFPVQGQIQDWNCRTGARCAWSSVSPASARICLDFEPGREYVFLITNENESITKRNDLQATDKIMLLKNNYQYRLHEANICVMDRVSWCLEDGLWHKETEVLRADREIRTALGLPYRSGSMLQPWFIKNGEKHDDVPVRIRYRFWLADDMASSEIPGVIYLAMEKPEKVTLYLNGHEVNTNQDNVTWLDIALQKLVICSDWLVPGENVVEMVMGYSERTDLEAIYLLGEFAVELDESRPVLKKLPDCLVSGDLSTQGFPFYTGRLDYRMELDLQQQPIRLESGERAILKLGSPDGAAFSVLLPDNREVFASWSPMEVDVTDAIVSGNPFWLSLYPSRRNTFGPLHQLPLFPETTGPDSFLTEGANWTDDYALIPSGLNEIPRIEVRS